jgi:DNA-binding GntR family transcriptional regulator
MTKLARVCDSIVGRIESGALRQGDRLPSEERLAAGFRVSVGTVQKALSRLAHSGLISREHGRGTFVSGSRVGPGDVHYLRFRDADGRDLPHYINVRSVRRSKRQALVGVSRRRREHPHRGMMSVGGKVDLYSEFWLREAEFVRLKSGLNGAHRRELEKNLRVLLGQELALPTLRVDQVIRFELLPEPVARDLGLEPEHPGFVMEMRGYTLRDRPLFYQRVCAAPFSENLVIVR